MSADAVSDPKDDELLLEVEARSKPRQLERVWRDSLESHSIMNDSCYQGTSMLQTVFSTWDQVGLLCYNDALDLSDEANRGGAFFSGSPGLLNRDDIPKPSYYVFDFLSHLNTGLLLADDSAFVSANDMGNYQVVCHNCARLGTACLATPEDQLDYQLMDGYYSEQGERRSAARPFA